MTRKMTALEKWNKRFMPEPNSGCHLWMGYLNANGYGETNFKGHSTNSTLAHRIAWELFVGKIPEGLGVLHRCDNPACVNPEHLFLGTQADNMWDMSRKGRWGIRQLPKGRDHHRWNAKLTDEDVLTIRKDARPHTAIAKEYGVDPATISNVKTGKSYVHVSTPVDN
jgi:hypothetical protein